MTDQGICSKCGQRNGCKHVYQQLADYQGPSVLGRVFIALVLPLLIFVISLAILSSPTAKWADSSGPATVLNLLISAGLTGIYIIAAAIVFRWLRENRQKHAGVDEQGKI